MFEKFAQADNPDARKKGGTGLGLSIAKEIINRLGGEIGFDDAPGGGTTFHFELPDWATLAKTGQAPHVAEAHEERSAA
jgi:signal transduction histidine kinase